MTDFNVGSGQKCPSCGATVSADRQTCHDCGHSMTASLEERVENLELAVQSLARVEFGDSPGHPFRGNQHTGGGGDDKAPTNRLRDEKDRLERMAIRGLTHSQGRQLEKIEDELQRRSAAIERVGGGDSSIQDIAERVKGLRGPEAASEDRATDHVHADDLRALGGAAAEMYDTNVYNEVTAQGPYGDPDKEVERRGVDQGQNSNATSILRLRDEPERARFGDAQRVVGWLERNSGGSTDSDRVDWNEVSSSEFV